MWILWPSFLMAGVGSAVVFALVDPQDIIVLDTMQFSRNAVYAVGFFLFWLMTAASSALTFYMAPRSPLKTPSESLP
jgi:hypothetical protein